jgi:tetratricopeptide (TPR) repeat protein
MALIRMFALVFTVLLGTNGSVSGQGSAPEDEQIAPLLEGLGKYQHPITIPSGDPLVQRFFDQGLMLSHSFNHREAERSFREAARRDPDCAMCYWGVALVNGPNINSRMDDDQVPVAWEALRKALSLADRVSEEEQAYINALAARYGPEPVEDRAPLDLAYAEAMKEVATRYPDDPDAVTLYAEALMDLHPWDYWLKNGEPRPWTQEIVTTLESVRRVAPDHPLGNHLYIHAVEASQTPERGLEAARRLGNVAPGAGHLVRMPSHIYIRVGEYHEGTLANQRAVESDNRYVTQCHAQGIYPLAYIPRNHHFLWATATLEGRSQLAIEAARSTAEMIDPEMMRVPGMGTLQHFHSVPLHAFIRFGKWEEILDHPEPDQDLLYPRGVWHYARGLAFARTGRLDLAEDELAQLQTTAADSALQTVTIRDINRTDTLMKIASLVLEGEIAAKAWDFNMAVTYLEQAIELEDGLAYNEPPDWFFPVRQNLGAVLIEAGRFADAERVYQEDLEVFPRNGWSLYGMAQALRGQQKNQAARRVEEKFEKAWQWSDVSLPGSRF